MSRFTVYAKWDSEAGVWTAFSDDIPGLVTEAQSWDELKERLRAAAAELIQLNNVKIDRDGGELHIVTDERVSVLAAA
jgi:predicted RNase H-like HicB family nuclease